MKDPKGYRETLEYLNDRTENKAWLSATEIAELMGVDRSTVSRRFGIHKGCAITVLAKRMVEESR